MVEDGTYTALSVELEKEALPARLRWLLPLLAAANVVFLVVGAIGVGTRVRLEGYAPLGLITAHDVQEVSLVSSMRGLYEAKAWLLLFAVGLMSGLWPYVKVLSTWLCVQLVDVGSLTKRSGYQKLELLEALGKWSFADINILCLNAIIFDISTDEYTVLVFFKLRIDVYWKYSMPLFLLVGALSMSTFLTYWAIVELAPSQKAYSDSESAPLVDAESLKQNETHPVSICWRALRGICFGGLAPALLCVAATMPMIVVRRGGFLANLIPEANDRGLDRDLPLSLWSVFDMLNELASFRQQSLLVYLSILWLLLNFICPLLELVLLSISYLVTDFHWKFSRCCRWAAECASGFSCLEVMLVSVIFTSIELPQVVNHQIAGECSSLKEIYEGGLVLSMSGLGMAASPYCYSLEGSYQLGFALMVVVVMLRSLAWRVLKD